MASYYDMAGIVSNLALKPGPEAQTRHLTCLTHAARCVTPPGRAPLRSMRALLAAFPADLMGSGPAAGVRPAAAEWLGEGKHATQCRVGVASGGVTAGAAAGRMGGADPAAIGRRLMGGMTAADAVAAEMAIDPADDAAHWVATSLLPMFVAFIDGPRAPHVASAPGTAEPDDAQGAEKARPHPCPLFSDLTFRSTLVRDELGGVWVLLTKRLWLS